MSDEISELDDYSMRRLKAMLDAFDSGRLNNNLPVIRQPDTGGPQWTKLALATTGIPAASGVTPGSATVELWDIDGITGLLSDQSQTLTAYNVSGQAIPTGVYVGLIREPFGGNYLAIPLGTAPEVVEVGAVGAGIINISPGLIDGCVLVAVATIDYSSIAPTSPTGDFAIPAGWTLLSRTSGSGVLYQNVLFYKVWHTGDALTYSFGAGTLSGITVFNVIGQVLMITDVDPPTVWGNASGTGTATETYPAITIPTDGGIRVITHVRQTGGVASVTGYPGWTQGGIGAAEYSYKIGGVAGVDGPETATYVAVSDYVLDVVFLPSIGITVPWNSITGTPTTLSGYGIASPLPPNQGGTGVTSLTGIGAPSGGSLGSVYFDVTDPNNPLFYYQ